MSDAIISSAGPLSVAVLSLLTVRFTLRGLGDAAYGVWIAAITLGEALSFLNLGIGRTISRHVTRRASNGTDLFLEAAFLAHMFFGVLGAVALAIAGTYLPSRIGVTTAGLAWAGPLFTLAGVVFLANQIVAFCNEVLIGQQRFRAQNFITTASAAVRFLGLLLLVWTGMTPLRVGVLHAVLAAATAVCALFAINPPSLGLSHFPRSVHWRALSENLRFGVLSQLIAGLASVIWQSGPLIIGVMLGSAAITPYYVGMRFPAVLLAAAWNIASVLFPAAGKWSEEDDNSRIVLRVGARLAFLVIAPAALVLMLVPDMILAAWLGSVPAGAAFLLRFATIAVVVDAIASSSVQLLWAHAILRPIVTGTAAGAVVALTATVSLVPQFGVGGAAVGLCLAILVAGACYVTASLRRAKYPARRFRIDLFDGVLLPLLAAGLLLKLVVRVVTPTNSTQVFSLCGVIELFFYLAFWRLGANIDERALVGRAGNKVAAFRWRILPHANSR